MMKRPKFLRGERFSSNNDWFVLRFIDLRILFPRYSKNINHNGDNDENGWYNVWNTVIVNTSGMGQRDENVDILCILTVIYLITISISNHFKDVFRIILFNHSFTETKKVVWMELHYLLFNFSTRHKF